MKHFHKQLSLKQAEEICKFHAKKHRRDNRQNLSFFPSTCDFIKISLNNLQASISIKLQPQ